MKVILDLHGWRKKTNFYGSVLSGRVKAALYPPLTALLQERDEPIPKQISVLEIIFEYRGKHEGTVPIFEYVP